MVVDDVSISVSQGEIVGLLGPNGAGKTTSFYMIVGLIKPNAGKVFLNDEEITEEPMYKRAKRGIGYLAQEASVFRAMSVEDNLKTVLEFTKLTKEEQHQRMESLLDEFGLQHIRKSKGNTLSGGERRRTEIARSLAVDPHFILLDEPFAGVDPIAVEDIQTIVSRLKAKNIGILITDHNVHRTLHITDRSYLLFEGKIMKTGTSEELANDEDVRRSLPGKEFQIKKIESVKSFENSGVSGVVPLPFLAVYLLCFAEIMQCHLVFLSCHTVPLLIHIVPLPFHIVPLPFHFVFLPFRIVTLPFHSVALPFHAENLPFHIVTLPFHVVTLPFHVVTLPFHIVTLPFHAVTLPTDSENLQYPAFPLQIRIFPLQFR